MFTVATNSWSVKRGSASGLDSTRLTDAMPGARCPAHAGHDPAEISGADLEITGVVLIDCGVGGVVVDEATLPLSVGLDYALGLGKAAVSANAVIGPTHQITRLSTSLCDIDKFNGLAIAASRGNADLLQQ